jgi:Cu-Zn family superoxide dismutase
MKTLFLISTVCVASLGPICLARAADGANETSAVAVLHPTAGQHCQGVVRFTGEGDGVKVVADLEGLTPGQKHAFHIHQYGDCSSPDGMSAGGHYNPEKHQHGLPETENRHAGDLGNVQADQDGKAHYEITVHNITVGGAKNPILGRAVIVHAKVDDGGQPTGNAGGRIACGVIGVANPGK